ncbi:MAG: NAD-dependent epimerase/dehydratase family protein [Oceanococcus sp.]
MNKAFVTGGSGFVGRNLIRRLKKEGIAVVALARSESAANAVAALGARPARGDLLDVDSLIAAMQGCEVVFHAAAMVDDWGPRATFWQVNVIGTETALKAAKQAGVQRFIHVGTEAIYADGKSSMAALDETSPLPDKPLPRYPQTKQEAEKQVLAASSDGFSCVSVRPRLIWGNDDTSVLPKLLSEVATGKFVWPDHGNALTSTCHVDNVCEGLWLAAQRGRAGEAYFLSDGDPVSYRKFLGAQFLAHGHAIPTKSIPLAVANVVARSCEYLWEHLPLSGNPPVHRLMIELGAKPVVIHDDKARKELGYLPVFDRANFLKQNAID